MLSMLSQAWRSWAGAKAVAILASVALAFGIGSATAVYTVVNTVMLKPLPYSDGHRFVVLYGTTFDHPEQFSSLAFPDLQKYQQQTHSFDAFGWFRLANFNLTSPAPPQHISGVAVTPSLVHNLGVSPMVGQWFNDETEAVISNALWRRLGADPKLVGNAIILSGRPYTITGVMPPGFSLPVAGPGMERFRTDVWVFLDPSGRGQNPREFAYFCYARLKPGVPLTQAVADVKRVAAGIARQDPADHPSYTAALFDLRAAVIKEIRPTLLLLLAAAGLLLLITCANVAGLLLARSVARARETAIRVALGAARRQLAVHYFLEGLLVSLAGAAAGVLLSIALVRIVVSIAAEFIPRADEIAIDWTVLLFALAAACLAAALSSLAPLWQALRTLPGEVLSDTVRASAGARSRKLSQWLVISEIGLAFTLLAVSAVLIAHLDRLRRVWPGFDQDHLLTFQITVPDAALSTYANRSALQRRLIEALEAIPSVTGAAFVNQLPLAGCCYSTAVYPEGQPLKPDVTQKTSFLPVSSGYFRTMRIPLRSGRLLTDHDTSDNPVAVVINEAAARHYWPGRHAVGAYGRIGGRSGSRFQVVGVVGDVRNETLAKPTVPEVYVQGSLVSVTPMHFVVRSTLPASALVPEIRQVVHNVDPEQPIHHVAAMREIVRGSLTLERVGSFMTAFFAIAALLLATLGVYGVVSYSVRQRTVEFGARMALGAVSRDLLTLVVGGGLKMAAFGVAIGGLAVVAATSVLFRVFEIRDLGLVPFLYSTAIVAAVATVASFFPAWRATLLSPMVAIRDEPASMWRRRAPARISGDDAPVLAGPALLTAFLDASRRASTFVEALGGALAALCRTIGTDWAVLVETSAGQEFRCTAAVPPRHSELTLPARGFLLNRLRFYPFPLPLDSGDFDTWLRWAGENKPEHVAEIERLRDSGARIAVPLRTKNEILGALLLGLPAGRQSYSASEKQLLRHCAEQFALMVENGRLTDRVVEQEKLRRDLALAAEVQKRLLPTKPPEASFAQLAAVSLPARSVGGDYYDFLEAGDHRLGIALADVAGKGVAAALLMSVVQASLRMIAAEPDVSLPQLAARMNRFLHRSTGSSSYATFFYAQIDETSRELRYVNAGHNPPYLLRSIDSQSEIHELSTGGTVLGLFPMANYEEAAVELRPGDVLIAFTDGVTEALNPDGEEFGDQRLKDLLRQSALLPVHEISSRISRDLTLWMNGAEQHDDLTFVVMKVGQPH